MSAGDILYQNIRTATQGIVRGFRYPANAYADPTQAGFDFHHLYEQIDSRTGKPVRDSRTGKVVQRRQHLPYRTR